MRINRRRRPFSLATRLTLFISLSTIIAFVAFTWIILRSVEQHFAEQDNSDLQHIRTTLTTVLQNTPLNEQQKIERVSNVLASYPDIFVVLHNQNNQLLYRSDGGPDPDSVTEVNHSNYRILTSAIDGGYRLTLALPTDFHLHFINQLKNNLIIIALIIGLFIIIIVLIAVYQGHQPLRNVSVKIKNITSENLAVRLDPNRVPIELEQLVISFNQLLARIEEVFTRQANFSADIAHEIRTPVTNLVTQTEIVLSQRRSNKELEDLLYSNLEEYQRMAKMVSDMLFLAQADNHQLIPGRAAINLRAETSKVFDFFEAMAEEQQVGLKYSGDAAVIEGDPLMLRRVINNLLSNAIRYTPAGHCVTVYISQSETTVALTVENPGTPIAPQHLPRLFDRFYRVDPSRQRNGEGSGIGLAIVKSIVTAHQGSINVASDAVSTRFTILLPRRAG